MTAKLAYLDSSAIAKRYLAEAGTEAVDALYHQAEAREVVLAFSLWNLGEVLGAIFRAEKAEAIAEDEADTAAQSLVQEARKLHSLGALRLVPVRGDLLGACVILRYRHGLSQPDALQVASCRDVGAAAFVTSDRRLLEAARAEGLNAWDPVKGPPAAR